MGAFFACAADVSEAMLRLPCTLNVPQYSQQHNVGPVYRCLSLSRAVRMLLCLPCVVVYSRVVLCVNITSCVYGYLCVPSLKQGIVR